MIKPDPLVPLWLTRGVPERIGASGDVVTELDEDAVRAGVEELLDAGTESLTIAFLNSYVNSAHERRAREIALELRAEPAGLDLLGPGLRVPRVRAHADRGAELLHPAAGHQVRRRAGVAARGRRVRAAGSNIVRSDGGTMSARSTKERPVDIAFSGPSGGAVGAAYLARRIGVPNVLTFDMGGTSTDVALCRDGEVSIKREAQLGYYNFQARGADIHSVGRRWRLDRLPQPRRRPEGGAAQRGRRSRARLLRPWGHRADRHRRQRRARPPARRLEARWPARARRRGGAARRRDGRRGPRHRHGRRRPGDHRHRQREHARRPARRVSVERGYDPRDFGLVAFGGAGPLHANALARLIGADPLVIPNTPGVLSAFGFLAAEVQNEFARTYLKLAEETPGSDVKAAVDELVEEAGAWLVDEGVDPSEHVFEVFADCRYQRQDIQMPCALDRSALDNGYAQRLRADFEAEHRRRYGFDLKAFVEIATLRGRRPRDHARRRASRRRRRAPRPKRPSSAHEQVHFDGEWHDTPIYERHVLGPRPRPRRARDRRAGGHARASSSPATPARWTTCGTSSVREQSR